MTVRNEVEDLFAEAQSLANPHLDKELARAGMHIIAPRMTRKGVVKTPERLAAMRVYMRQRRENALRDRVVSGEQPRYRGALATWYRLADELGIDTSGWRLPRPVTP